MCRIQYEKGRERTTSTGITWWPGSQHVINNSAAKCAVMKMETDVFTQEKLNVIVGPDRVVAQHSRRCLTFASMGGSTGKWKPNPRTVDFWCCAGVIKQFIPGLTPSGECPQSSIVEHSLTCVHQKHPTYLVGTPIENLV